MEFVHAVACCRLKLGHKPNQIPTIRQVSTLQFNGQMHLQEYSRSTCHLLICGDTFFSELVKEDFTVGVSATGVHNINPVNPF